MNKDYRFQKVLIIPVYLKLRKPDEIPASEGISLLKRAIESLFILEDNELTIIAVFCIDTPSWQDEFDTVLRKTVAGFSLKFPLIIFTEKNLKSLKEYLKGRGYGKMADKLSACGYSNIRNCGLVAANTLGADAVIFIDNDEVIEDKEFLKTAGEYAGADYNGIKVDGKGGFYISEKGEIVEKPFFHWWQILWNKSKLISETMKKILNAYERLVESPIILGGNLVLHKNLFSIIPFDPLIPRGEDIDYLINSKRMGFNILFDKKLRIKHLPPQRTVAFRKSELKGDIERFLYEREKIKGADISLNPYPGYFLKNTLPLKAILTIHLLALHLLLRLKIKDAIEILNLKNLLFLRWDNAWQGYLEFQKEWARLMNFITENRDDIIPLIQ